MRVLLAYVFCCLLWGSTWLFIKLGLRDLPPLSFAAARMALAAAVLLPFAARARFAGLARSDWARIGAVGLLQIGTPYALLFAGQQWVTSALAAVLFATFPVWLLLLARALLPHQPLTLPKVAAAVLGIAGVAVLQVPAMQRLSLGARAATGGSFIVAAAVLVALANVLIRRMLAHHVPVVLTFVQIAAGALMLVALAALLEHGRTATWTPRAFGAVAYLAIFGTAIPYLFLFWLLPRIPVAAIGAIPLLDTTFAVFLGTVVLREPLEATLLAGGALVFSGAALANFAGAGRLETLPESG
ncbi:MAG TPA: DMT family transporter [Myxococcales bacterium]|nr:DMT family transporter [Myxococcales bacterium]